MDFWNFYIQSYASNLQHSFLYSFPLFQIHLLEFASIHVWKSNRLLKYSLKTLIYFSETCENHVLGAKMSYLSDNNFTATGKHICWYQIIIMRLIVWNFRLFKSILDKVFNLESMKCYFKMWTLINFEYFKSNFNFSFFILEKLK